jgi:hypothetical protein
MALDLHRSPLRRGPAPYRKSAIASLLGQLSEAAIHTTVVSHLKARCAPGVAWTHVPNGEARPGGTGGKLKAMGVKAGWPDLQFIVAGRALFLELKTDTGRVSAAQSAMHTTLRAAGAEVAVTHGLDAALAQLTRWGVLR